MFSKFRFRDDDVAREFGELDTVDYVTYLSLKNSVTKKSLHTGVPRGWFVEALIPLVQESFIDVSVSGGVGSALCGGPRAGSIPVQHLVAGMAVVAVR